MADNPNLIIPSIGMSGYWTLSPPFDTLIIASESYTCQAIRRLNDYIANNEDPAQTIYQTYGLTDVQYQADLSVNMYIVSIQSDTDNWLYVPANHILKLPVSTGVAYRNVVLGVSLGAIPADTDLTSLTADIASKVYDSLGITPEIKPVVTSGNLLVDYDEHLALVATRQGRITTILSPEARYQALQVQYDRALTIQHALEQYIIAHLPPP